MADPKVQRSWANYNPYLVPKSHPFFTGCFSWMIPNLYIKNGCFTKLGVSLNGGTPISHPKCCSFLVEKPMGLLGKPTILGTPHILYPLVN